MQNTGATALMFAASRGHLNVIKYLISIPFIKIQQEDKVNWPVQSVVTAHEKLAAQSLDSIAQAGFTALRYCEDADKEFANMNEMLHLLGLDTPPVEMVSVLTNRPIHIFSVHKYLLSLATKYESLSTTWYSFLWCKA